ncbi:GRAS domain family [Musa troglodytarum]|uniref:GRAS domain family n=1 Tax=Musa troglodytarum TaxID=320322 RepID=A0A9E7GQH3_9LILI|nr:GRAS domain family [Musa troglodytarum]
MLAGCSSTLLSPRHKLRIDASVQLQACHFQIQEKHCPPQQQKMGTQRLDLPCGFASRKDPLRVALSVEKPGAETRGTSCSFRRNPVTHSSSSSMVARTSSWGGTGEIDGGRGGPWERRRSLKRFHERGSCDDYRAKRTRTGGIAGLVDVEGEVWLPQSTQEPPLVEGDKVFLVPTAASFPLPSSSSHTLVGGSSGPDNDLSTASNGSRIPCSSGVADAGCDGDGSLTEQQGLELVRLLTSCAESISTGNYEAMNFFLARLGEMATPQGTPIHRVVAYCTEALALRVARLRPRMFSVAPPRSLLDPTEDDNATALRLLDCVSPIPKFLHFTLNERLLKALEGRDRVHIIDFNIKQGLQWPSLFQSLASRRPNPPSHVRLTGVGESRQDLQDTGIRLARLAESFNLAFEFHAVVDRLEDVRLWMLHVKREECLAVNCVLTMHKALHDESGKAFMDLLDLIRSTHPEIVVVAEPEAKHNEPNWETRLARSLSYYAAIFDSMDDALPKDSQARIKVEEVFAKEIRNIVACEGDERTERHESFDGWSKLMEDGGFRCLGIGEREMLQGRMILRMYSCEKYSLEKQGEGDGLTLMWLDQPLYTVSAWAPGDVAGSSSVSQPS